jgi:tetratricopeptide (TPR) repeat protein
LTLLGEARRLRPDEPALAAAYAQALYTAGNLPAVTDVLAPFAGEGKEPDADILLLLGKAAHGLGRYEEAAALYNTYLTRFGVNIEVLNFLGTCHYQLGRKDEALKAWKKSLELNPDQERIRKLVDDLSRK